MRHRIGTGAYRRVNEFSRSPVQPPPLIAHIAAGLSPSAGGPSRSIVGVADALAECAGHRIVLLYGTRAGASEVPSQSESVKRIPASASSRVLGALGLEVRQGLRELLASEAPRVLHCHGLWSPACHWACRTGVLRDIPVVTHPRGMLEPWALEYRSWKKRLAMMLYQRRDLESVAVFIATAEQEAESIRRVGLRQPIAVIPNGVDIPLLEGLTSHTQYGERRERIALFMSRLHPIKNLKGLLAAWSSLGLDGWRLVVAGPDEVGHRAELEREVRALRLGSCVEFVGEVEGKDKERLFRSAHLFVLPSFSENFGIVVAEAMSYGLPVIATHGTPWAELARRDCGWWVPPTPDGIANALRLAVGMNDEQRAAMGARARTYAREFDWSDIARKTAGVYDWILGRGPRPKCVLPE